MGSNHKNTPQQNNTHGVPFLAPASSKHGLQVLVWGGCMKCGDRVEGWITLPPNEVLLRIYEVWVREEHFKVINVLSRFYGIDPPGVSIDPDIIYTCYKNSFLNIAGMYAQKIRHVYLKVPHTSLSTDAHEFLHHLGRVANVAFSEKSCHAFGEAVVAACSANPLLIAQRYSRKALQYFEFIEKPRTRSEVLARFGKYPWVLRSSSPLITRYRVKRQAVLQLNAFGREVLAAIRIREV